MLRPLHGLLIVLCVFASVLAQAVTLPTMTGDIEKSNVRPALSGVTSFTEWKNQKIENAAARIRKLSSQLSDLRTVNPKSSAIATVQSDLQQEKWNLEAAQDLTLKDYLVLHLKPLESQGRLNEAAARMSPEEVKQLLAEYFHLVDRSQANQVSRARLGIQQ